MAGIPWANVEALRRKGVDARLVVFERYRLHPEADWSLDRAGGFIRRQLAQWRGVFQLLPPPPRLPLFLRLAPPPRRTGPSTARAASSAASSRSGGRSSSSFPAPTSSTSTSA